MRAALLALALAGGTASRDLPVPANKGWQHAATGLVLRPTLLGLPRTHLTDLRTDERDIYAQFNDPAIDTSATVYLFRPAEDSVAIWFDRAEYELMHRENTGGASPAGAIVPFAPPGSDIPAGLRRVYTPARLPNRGDALAVLPLGEWLVVVRLTSTHEGPAALDATLTRLIGELGWPAAAPRPTAAAVPVADCPTRLKTKHAGVRPPDMMQMLLGSALANPGKGHATVTPTAASAEHWCREGEGNAVYGVYRKPGLTGSYLIALRDAGRTMTVFGAPSIKGLTSGGGYVPTLHDLGGEANIYPTFDRLPQPAQVVDLLQHGAPVSRVTADAAGKTNVTISADQLKK